MRRAVLLGATLLAVSAQAPPRETIGPRETTASGQRATVDEMLTALRQAPNEQVAGALEGQLRDQWRNQASPALKLLLARGVRELSEGAAGDAADSFDAALDLDPHLLDAWRGRAQARLRLGDAGGAIRDIEEVLRREPRNFLAWQDLSRIAEARGDWSGALSAWEKMLEFDPRSPGAQDRLRELRRRALGEET